MRVAVHCTSHNLILDEGEIDSGSGLLLWNDFTTATKHLNCCVVLRSVGNLPRDAKREIQKNGTDSQ